MSNSKTYESWTWSMNVVFPPHGFTNTYIHLGPFIQKAKWPRRTQPPALKASFVYHWAEDQQWFQLYTGIFVGIFLLRQFLNEQHIDAGCGQQSKRSDEQPGLSSLPVSCPCRGELLFALLFVRINKMSCITCPFTHPLNRLSSLSSSPPLTLIFSSSAV